MTTVKVKLGSDIRRFQFEDGTTLKQLEILLDGLFPQQLTGTHQIKYIDEENDLIPIGSDFELVEAINVAKSLKPPILRLSITFPDTSANQIESISNWGKKLIEEDQEQSQAPHIVKVCGKEVEVIPNRNNVQVNLSVQQKSVQTVEATHDNTPKRKTIKDTVEEYSEGTSKKSKAMSEEVALRTQQYSDNTGEKVLPMSEKTSGSMLNTQDKFSDQITTSSVQVPDANINDNLRSEVYSKMDHMFKETEKNMENASSTTNRNTEHYFSDVSLKMNDIADDAIKRVTQKTEDIINVVDQARAKVNINFDVNIREMSLNNDSIMLEIGNKVNNLSVNTSGKLSDISEDIKKNIMSI